MGGGASGDWDEPDGRRTTSNSRPLAAWTVERVTFCTCRNHRRSEEVKTGARSTTNRDLVVLFEHPSRRSCERDLVKKAVKNEQSWRPAVGGEVGVASDDVIRKLKLQREEGEKKSATVATRSGALSDKRTNLSSWFLMAIAESSVLDGRECCCIRSRRCERG